MVFKKNYYVLFIRVWIHHDLSWLISCPSFSALDRIKEKYVFSATCDCRGAYFPIAERAERRSRSSDIAVFPSGDNQAHLDLATRRSDVFRYGNVLYQSSTNVKTKQ